METRTVDSKHIRVVVDAVEQVHLIEGVDQAHSDELVNDVRDCDERSESQRKRSLRR